MIKSMTGYGRGERSVADRKIIAEIRSLNSKQLDLSVKTASCYRSLEYDIRAIAIKSVQRGKAEVSIFVESQNSSSAVNINKDLFNSYFRQLQSLGQENGVGVDSNMIATVLRMPDVVKNDIAEVSDDERLSLFDALKDALSSFDAFRLQEGKTLIDDLKNRIGVIKRLLKEVELYEKDRVEVVKSRITDSIKSIGIDVDKNRLEQEMIYYIEKLDITEEKVRLDNHCNYFIEVAEQEDGVGKKLGFITQEIGREINTLGSKANDARIQKIVVEMKDELEKIKEQLLNIL